jgi:3-oxoacyl-[acyl-carrier-protein] synthase II
MNDPPPRRVVLTGTGLVTPLGTDADSVWAALAAGCSGVRTLQAFDASALPVQFGGEIDGFDVGRYIDKKDRKRIVPMPRTVHLGVAAAQLAVADAGNLKEIVDPARFGVVLGVSTVGSDLEELQAAAVTSYNPAAGEVDLARWGRDGVPQIPPTWLLNHVPNMTACHVSILHNAQGPNNTLTQSDIASLLALGEAFGMVRQGRADAVLAGGADAKLVTLTLARHCTFAPLSRRNEAPELACRPFERHRDGLVLGEGACVFAVEELDHARRRGAKIVAEVRGFGAAFDAGRTGEGLARAVRAALRQANVSPAELDHVSAHGYGTRTDDIWEARGLLQVLGRENADLPVYAAKAATGDLGTAAGAAELAFSLLALARGTLPGTLNYDEPDPDCPLNVSRAARPVRRRHVLKVGITERGQCAALVCRLWDEDDITP